MRVKALPEQFSFGALCLSAAIIPAQENRAAPIDSVVYAGDYVKTDRHHRGRVYLQWHRGVEAVQCPKICDHNRNDTVL